jgi:hypothetical protein
MKNFKQNLRLAFAAIALLFVATVASVKADIHSIDADDTISTSNSTIRPNFDGPALPMCLPGRPCVR